MGPWVVLKGGRTTTMDMKGDGYSWVGCIIKLKSKEKIIMILISPSILPRKQISKLSTLKFIVISYLFFIEPQAREGN